MRHFILGISRGGEMHDPTQLDVSQLVLDLNNPRGPLAELSNENEAIAFLVEQADVGELVSSIALTGWLNVEPLIVLKDGNIVLEGNRRLAALRLIRDQSLANRLGVSVPSPKHENATPEKVLAIVVEKREDARDYIGFKHINGPFKWDSFAKAKFAADWIDDGVDAKEVARRLGDAHNTVVRLVNGFRVFQQAESEGFSRTDIPGRFSFSHLYTALTRSPYRVFLGLPETTELLERSPVPESRKANLRLLMVWLFGQGDKRALIASQNPDLKRLATVLPSDIARQKLEQSWNLDEAYALVEDRHAAFSSALLSLSSEAKRTAGLIGNYEHSDELLDVARATVKTVRGIEASMVAESESRDVQT